MESPFVAPGRRVSLRGRADECALLDGLLRDIRRLAAQEKFDTIFQIPFDILR